MIKSNVQTKSTHVVKMPETKSNAQMPDTTGS